MPDKFNDLNMNKAKNSGAEGNTPQIDINGLDIDDAIRNIIN
ncbi:MAG: hypothetical protein ACKE5M_04195 [Methylophilaceae bacterium]